MPIHPIYWQRATQALSARDPVMRVLIHGCPEEGLTSHGDAFVTLVRAVLGQQISVRAADAVWGRMLEGMGMVTPRAVLTTQEAVLKSFGLSRQKVACLHRVAEGFEHGALNPQRWPEMDDAAVMNELTSLKGIGRWTAEMFLIFHLMRPDVLPLADIGLQKAAALHYGEAYAASREGLLALAEPWRPWRTVATWYLWRSLDPVPVAY